MTVFESPNRQLKRAIRKCAQFYALKAAYFESNYRATVVEIDPKTGCKLTKMKIVAFPPDDLTDVIDESIQLFRSALDQTAYAAATVSGVAGVALEKIAFPVSRDPNKIESSIGSACQGMRPEFIDLFRSHRPYLGGNDALANLNGIRRQAYHRFVIPVGAVGDVRVGHGSMTERPPAYIPSPIWDRENHELVYAVEDPSGAKFGYDAEVAFDIAFGEVEAVTGQPVRPFLIQAAEAVDAVVRDAERLAHALGLASGVIYHEA